MTVHEQLITNSLVRDCAKSRTPITSSAAPAGLAGSAVARRAFLRQGILVNGYRNLVLAVIGCALVACGGGGGSSPSSSGTSGGGSSSSGGSGSGSSSSGGTVSLSLSGTAAVGLPIVGATVSIICTHLDKVATTETGTDGSWSATLAGAAVPCVLELTGGTINGVANTTAYHSIAVAAGTTNITPLSDLMVGEVASTAGLTAWFAGLTGSSSVLSTLTPTLLSNAWSGLGTFIGSGGLQGVPTPITTAFTPTPGNPIDGALTAVGAALAATGIAYPTLLTEVATNLAPPPNLGSSIDTFLSAITTPATNRGSGSFTVGGTVSGLPSNLTIFLWNGNDTLAITGNGRFTFPSTLATGATYAVNDAVPTLAGQSPNTFGVSCTIANGSGTIAAASVTNVAVSCGTFQLNPPTSTAYFGYVGYDPTRNVGVISYNDPTGGGALSEEQLACQDASAACYTVSALAAGQCAAIASTPRTGSGGTALQYQYGVGIVNSTQAGGDLTLTGALAAAQAEALQNCNAPPVSTTLAPPSSSPAPAACTLVVSACVDGTAAGTVTGGGHSSSSSGSSSGGSSGGGSSSSSSGGGSSSSSSSGGSSSGPGTTLQFSGTYNVSGTYYASANDPGTVIADSGTFSGTAILINGTHAASSTSGMTFKSATFGTFAPAATGNCTPTDCVDFLGGVGGGGYVSTGLVSASNPPFTFTCQVQFTSGFLDGGSGPSTATSYNVLMNVGGDAINNFGLYPRGQLSGNCALTTN